MNNPEPAMRKDVSFGIVLWVAILLSGCASIGPDSMVRDRFGYTTAITESWESQMLLNLVRARYGHAPVFLDVTSVITQYTLETQANVLASWQKPLVDNANTIGAGISGKYTDRPTITYSPLTGEKFARSLMTPIPPASIMGLIQAGYRANFLLRLCIQSINGIENSYGGAAAMHSADPRFYSLIDKIKNLQEAGGLGIKTNRKGENQGARIIFRSTEDEASRYDGADIRKFLRLDPDAREFKVVYGAVPSDDKEIAIMTRSMLQIMISIASTIEVPAEHVAEKRVTRTFRETADDQKRVEPLVRILTSTRRPDDAFVAVPFHGHWFFIDDKDIPSKNIFSFLMFILTLTETGGKEGGPIVTIPAG